MNLTEHNFLAHYGILGMKWGIRRYQNPDGSLTSAGRARYGGEKAERYRSKLIKKATRLNRNGKYDNAITNLNKASNDDMAIALMKRKHAAKKGGALGAGVSTVAAAAIRGVGNKPTNKYGVPYNELLTEGVAKAINNSTNHTGVAIPFDTTYGLANLTSLGVNAVAGYLIGKGGAKARAARTTIERYNRIPVSEVNNLKSGFNKQLKKSEKTEGKRSISRANAGEERAKAEYKPKAAALFKKYPQLYDDFGGPDMIDDWEMFELVVDDYRKGNFERRW